MNWSRPIKTFLELGVALWLLGLFAQRRANKTRMKENTAN
jgi:hypothetical protein